MQDIVFYAVANETLGSVRDYANARKKPAPILTLGVSVCLRMRLFAAQNDATPYPIDSFSGIVDWQWRMDNDFDRNTACKLVADPDSISVHTANDAFDGSTLHFTEFVIPISNMNTQELATWIGNEKRRSGLTGELVGYDSAGNAVFVLQIENFTIRNRVAGLRNPSAMDQEVVTRTQAESLIQAAVSASADTKQDKLNSSNAGTGISISSNGVISTANVPQSAVTGLSASLSAKQDSISAGDLMEISGTTVNRKRYMNIIPDSGILMRSITIPNSTTTVSACVLEPGNAYKINAVSSARWLATTAAFKGSTGMWGIEGHIKLFVAGTGYVRTDSNVVLANALEPDSVNNCTLRFHDGLAIITVEDHVAGYIVVNGSTAGDGSLYYGITTSTNDYVAFDASLNGTTIPLAGAVAEGEKHIVGNGCTETAITGAVDCGTSKFTVANLSLSDVQVTGGVMTLGDAYIPSGSTVAVSGGGLAVEKVTGSGSDSVIDLNSSPRVSTGASVFMSGVTLVNGMTSNGITNAYGVFRPQIGATVAITGCTFSDFRRGDSTRVYGVVGFLQDVNANMTSCSFINNAAGLMVFSESGACALNVSDCVFSNTTSANMLRSNNASATVSIEGTTFAKSYMTAYSGATINFKGTNILGDGSFVSNDGGSVTLTSGAILDLTGNTRPSVLEGGGITFESGGATVQLGATSGTVDSSYMMDNVELPAGAKLTNTAVVDLRGTNVFVPRNTSVSVSGCTVTGGVSSAGGAMFASSYANVDLNRVTFTGNSATNAGGAIDGYYNTYNLTSCVFFNNVAPSVSSGKAIALGDSATANASACEFNDGQSIYLKKNTAKVNFIGSNTFKSILGGSGTVTIASGAILDLTGNTNATPINPGGGITFESGGSTTIRYGSGTSSGTRSFEYVGIRGSSIGNLGIIYGATVYFPESHGPLDVWYTTDSGITSSLVQISGGTPTFVVDGGLVSVES